VNFLEVVHFLLQRSRVAAEILLSVVERGQYFELQDDRLAPTHSLRPMKTRARLPARAAESSGALPAVAALFDLVLGSRPVAKAADTSSCRYLPKSTRAQEPRDS
jgi:hypothetical protein